MKLTKNTVGIARLFAAIIALAVVLFAPAQDKPGAAALMPFMALPCRKEEEFKGGGSGGGAAVLPEAEFQAKVLSGIKKVEENNAEIERNFAGLDKEAKELAEKLEKQTKTYEGLPNQVAEVMTTMRKIEAKVAAERRSNFGSALYTITQDKDLNDAVNGIFRSIGRKGGEREQVPISADQEKAAKAYRKTLTEGASPGSTYINDALHTTIYSLIAEFGIWRSFDVIMAGTKTTKLIVDSTDPTMLFVDEDTAPAEAAYTGANVTATIKKILGWLSVSNEMLEDSEVNVAAHLLPKFANATARRIDFAALAADATADGTNGGFTGIFQGGTAVVSAATHTTIATTTYDDVLATLLGVNAAALSRPCKWFIHPQILVRMLGIKDLNGRPIFLPSIDAPSFGAVGSILGYPVQLCHAAPTANVASSKIAVFGDPQCEAVLLRKDFEFAMSDQVKFLEDKVVFRGRARIATKIKQADGFAVLTNAAA